MKGTLVSPSPRGIFRLLLRFPIVLYRLHLGWLLGRRFLLLTHVGRKTGVWHATVLEVLRYEQSTNRCLVASGWGEKAQWYRNVLENTDVRYTIGTREREGRARRITVEEADQELREYARRHPKAFRKLVKMMLGETFEGDDEQYGKLSKEVPVLEILPKSVLGAAA